MPARRAVLLTAQGSDPRLLPTILLESTLIGTLQVFILNNLKPFRMNKTTKSPHFAQFWCTVNPFKINTCKGNNILDSVRRFWYDFDSEERHEKAQNTPASYP